MISPSISIFSSLPTAERLLPLERGIPRAVGQEALHRVLQVLGLEQVGELVLRDGVSAFDATLAVVHGLCLTAGFELSLACDMIWAADSAQFGLVEIVVGLTPLMGGTQRVAERAGPARARELVMSGGLYSAETLERWNVVNRVLPDADLVEKATKFGQRLAAGPTLANAATKRIMRAQTDEGTRGADARTADIGASLFETEDLKGAVEKFLEQGPGKASFRGR